jgi:valyl-tRNA synthetase
MNGKPMEKAYDPHQVEGKWYAYWEENQLFRAKVQSDEKPFSIVIPPPNVTGSLHMGHALNNTLQDILCRYQRMRGRNVLWQPGTDHAGIATQNVVEKALASQGKDRHAVGREQFIQMVWEWRERYGDVIINQLKRLGCSCDWSRERFTMDEGLSRAVREVFVRLYEEGLIYRGDYIINWCPRCHTALADLEVEHEDKDSFLYNIRYPYEGGAGYLVVATTRPETLLGDTAVAVNPDDSRYLNLPSGRVLLPVLNRPIPVITDPYVDSEFGTGALKITPAHDANDFDIGNSHDLERIKVIDEDGKMNDQAGPYQGMDRFACRQKILQDLEDAGLLDGVEPYRHAVGHCYRCKTMIEPLLSKQWFVRVGPLAEAASRAVSRGKTRIYPTNWEGVYFEWMANIRDWCVSRQIWWGHRIPAWYCKNCGEVMVSKETPVSCTACHSDSLEQETDVLDTWFSSALWPFSTLGWPDSTPELRIFYPTSVLVTGFDILFFWVARMMMMGIHFMEEVPFRDVYIHALVRDAEGQKMSKSKGNVIDPLEVMDRFGTDAFRFTLAALAAQGRDIKLSEDRILGYRHFVNKIWNAARFTLMNVDGDGRKHARKGNRRLSDRWILTRLGQVSREVCMALDDYRFNDAANMCYQFVWHELCDWYLEMAKDSLYGENAGQREATRETVLFTLRESLKLLHPFMPFVTEEIWQRLPGPPESIMVAKFPDGEEWVQDEDAVRDMEMLMSVVYGIRNIRGEMNIPPSKKVGIVIDVTEKEVQEVLEDHQTHIRTLAKVEDITIGSEMTKPEASATAVFGKNQVHVLLRGILDFAEEKKRLGKAIQKLEKDIDGAKKKLTNKGFLEKAPADVVEEMKERVETLSIKLEKLNQNLSFFESIRD